MSSGIPPSSQRAPMDPRLEAARGLVRDSVGALKNLEQLLESIRVGPRALSSVIPDVHAACAPLRGALRELLQSLALRLPETGAVIALEAFVAPRIDDLEQALADAKGRALNARGRLVLEDVVTRSARDLDAARALIDVLDDAVSRPTISVDLSELVRQTFKGADAAARTVTATLRSTGSGCELTLNPRVATALVGIGVQLVATHAATTPPCVAIERSADGTCGVSVTPGPCEGEPLVIPARTLVEPTAICVEAAARAIGARVTRAADDSRFELSWAAKTP